MQAVFSFKAGFFLPYYLFNLRCDGISAQTYSTYNGTYIVEHFCCWFLILLQQELPEGVAALLFMKQLIC